MVLGGLLKAASTLLFLLVLAFAVFIGFLQRNPEKRHSFFAGVCTHLTNDRPEELAIRCQLLKDLKGKVLELGPGPATNAECFVGKPIESYVGIEPNTYFHPIFRNKTAPLDLTFPIELLPLEGESLGLADESVDQVIITHVLCSVRDVTQVLREVNRVLKPGGKIFLLEHIASPEGTLMRRVQDFIGPVWEIALDGCKFSETWKDLDRLRASGNYEVVYKLFDAPMPLTVVKPHLMGTAVKKGGQPVEEKGQVRMEGMQGMKL